MNILTTGGLPESNDCGVYKNLVVTVQPTAESETIHGEAVKSQFCKHSSSVNTLEYKLGSRLNKCQKKKN